MNLHLCLLQQLPLTSTLWMSVSSRSSTSVYVSSFSSWLSGSKNGGDTLGKLVKLLGKTADPLEAIADAFRIANGFLPVKLVYPWLPLSILEAPELVFSLREPADLAAAP